MSLMSPMTVLPQDRPWQSCDPSPAMVVHRESFDEFVRTYEPILRMVARRLCRNHDDANDLVQDTLERAMKSFDRRDARGRDRAWALTILRNLFIDRCRRERRHQLVALEDIPLSAPEPRDDAWSRIEPEQVRAAVAQLDHPFRTVYEMYAIERRSYREISAALGIPAATVGTRVLRARTKLRSLLVAAIGLDETCLA